MAEITTGVRGALSQPRVYEAWQRLLGAEPGRRRFVADHVRPVTGERVLDLGCGPGEMLPHLGDVDYVGVDLSAEYIDRARSRFGDRGVFHVGDATDIAGDLGTFDVVIAVGVLHHIDDDGVRAMLGFSASVLRPGGRIATLDPTLVAGQPRPARAMIARDRGQNVRAPEGYAALALTSFATVRPYVRGDLMTIPYTHCALEGTDPREPA